jgi:iron-sulfur cluster assembly accessory protein
METRADNLQSNLLSVTEGAAEKIKEFLIKIGRPYSGIRLRVVPSITRERMFEFDFANRILDNDIVIETNGVKLYINKMSLEEIKGAHIKFYQTLEGSPFRIIAPNKYE